MKIFCVGLNYVDHVKEFGDREVPTEPVIFSKPDTAILKNNEPFYFPEFSKEIDYETELVIKISKEGKYIDPKFALKYFDEIGLGIDFTARDLQRALKSKGHPWEISKGFNGSAPISDFVPVNKYADIQSLNFSLHINGQLRQQGNTADMVFKISDLISYISKYFLLKKGDLIFTGTPVGVGPVKLGDRLEGFLEDQKMLDFVIK
ncbi:MAG TPA: fumarylacetoacetate hydrolase family protein [Cytophagales bacterium]|nr:fumarylacetoacetate hydrolase family protein [Cytophagales bacterium]